MKQQVFCLKLKQMADKMNTAPFPGPLGQKIQEHISQAAWNMWLKHQTMLINEYRLQLIDPKAHAFLKEEMQKFLFEEGSSLPSGYTDPNNS